MEKPGEETRTPAAVLREEHGGIRIMLTVLEKICGRLREGQYPDPEHLERILEFLRVFVDGCHHVEEEECLFPEIGDAAERALIVDLLADHRNARFLMQGMEEDFPRARTGDGPAVNRLVDSASGYIDLLRSHIVREERDLFPRVESSLGKERRDALVREFERIGEKRFGRGKREEFRLLAGRLKEVYGA